MAIEEIETADGCNLNAEELVQSFDARIDSNYGGYFPDTRGISALGEDFVRLTAQAIDKQTAEGETVEFRADATDENVANLREELKIHTFRAPMLAIARTIVSDWTRFRFADSVHTKTCGTLFQAYCDAVLQPVNDESERHLNAAKYVPESDRLQAEVNEIPEDQTEHVSGKHLQDGAFLVYNGEKYNGPMEDPEVLMCD